MGFNGTNDNSQTPDRRVTESVRSKDLRFFKCDIDLIANCLEIIKIFEKNMSNASSSMLDESKQKQIKQQQQQQALSTQSQTIENQSDHFDDQIKNEKLQWNIEKSKNHHSKSKGETKGFINRVIDYFQLPSFSSSTSSSSSYSNYHNSFESKNHFNNSKQFNIGEEIKRNKMNRSIEPETNGLQKLIDEPNERVPLSQTEYLSFNAMIQKLFDCLLKAKEEICNAEFNKPRFNCLYSEYETVVKDLGKKLEQMRGAKEKLNRFIDPENSLFSDFKSECEMSVEKKISESFKIANKACESLSATITNIKDSDLIEFSAQYYNLLSYERNKELFKIEPPLKNVENHYYQKFQPIFNDVLSLKINSRSEAAKIFCTLKKIANQLIMFKTRLDEILDKLINTFVKENGGFDLIGSLAVEIKKYGIEGSIILKDHRIFEHYHRSIFNSKISKQPIDEILKDLMAINKNDVAEEDLKTAFAEFKSEFQNMVENHLLTTKKETKLLIENTRSIASTITVSRTKAGFNWDDRIKNKLPKLIGHIFALWSVLTFEGLDNSEVILKSKLNESEQKKYRFEPHPAQVIAIFRMLGIGYTNKEVRNSRFLNKNLVQIGTGEGKSVTLAAVACVLALLGIDVYCVCYSKYLSDRDYSAFKMLFSSLKIDEYVHYGTFSRICEQVINQRGDLREITKNYILDNDQIEMKKFKVSDARPKVLLIDEVDVFFSKDFYGSSYKPTVLVNSSEISILIQNFWKNRHEIDDLIRNFREKNLKEYKACLNKFKEWPDLINMACYEILGELKNFNNEQIEYKVINDRIAYKDQDSFVFDINYGYKTLFTYLLEHSKGNISLHSLDQNMGFTIRLGSFSYAEIPLNNFTSILGVTGTLDTLGNVQKEIIENIFGIDLKTFIPSVYGRNNLVFPKKFNEGIFIESYKTYFQVLKREIENRRVGTDRKTKRAVLVFFETKKELFEFYESSEYAPLKEKTKTLTEEASNDEKEAIINYATASESIVFFTRIFGRGTDFKTQDEIVSANGGVHVIQTFLSEQLSEEKQIKGRTARQSEDGSYSMVLSLEKLEKFGLNSEHLKKNENNIYECLNEARIKFSDAQNRGDKEVVSQLKKKHNDAILFIDDLIEKRFTNVNKFLVSQNKVLAIGQSCSRTLILLDATGSMSSLLESAKKTLEIMFERAFDILNDDAENSFQIKIVVYRNYNSPVDKILEHSQWESKHENLTNFLKTVRVSGGMGREAIEVALWYANQESKLNQVILIGDAAANTNEEILSKRAQNSRFSWEKSKYHSVGHFSDELAKLVKRGIKVHAFYVENDARENFKEIASKSKGNSAFLDIRSPQGPKQLIDLVTVEVLNQIGGSQYVQKYRNKYS